MRTDNELHMDKEQMTPGDIMENKNAKHIVSILETKLALEILHKKMYPNGEKPTGEFMVDVLICFFLTVAVEDDLMAFINRTKDIADTMRSSSCLKKELQQ